MKFYAILISLLLLAAGARAQTNVALSWPWAGPNNTDFAVYASTSITKPPVSWSLLTNTTEKAVVLQRRVRASRPQEYYFVIARYLTTPPAPTNSTVTLAWDASTGTNVVDYKVYQGIASGTYTNSTNSSGLLTVTLPVDPSVANYFAATALADNGLESDFSNEVSCGPVSLPSTTNLVSVPNLAIKLQ
jgi:hypothetical protein